MSNSLFKLESNIFCNGIKSNVTFSWRASSTHTYLEYRKSISLICYESALEISPHHSPNGCLRAFHGVEAHSAYIHVHPPSASRVLFHILLTYMWFNMWIMIPFKTDFAYMYALLVHKVFWTVNKINTINYYEFNQKYHSAQYLIQFEIPTTTLETMPFSFWQLIRKISNSTWLLQCIDFDNRLNQFTQRLDSVWFFLWLFTVKGNRMD